MPVKGNKLYCPDCNAEQPQINLTVCNRCGCSLGAPNVNEVSTEIEQNALQKRYEDAIAALNSKGLSEIIKAFECFFIDNVRAVINAKFEVLCTIFLADDPYKNYYRITDEGIKNIALPINDRHRCIVDSYMFGSYGTKMAFAALSLNNTGLTGYDNCTIVLDEKLIQKRATILEENSFNFVARHSINVEQPEVPHGYRALWENKHLLAIAKLQNSFSAATTSNDFCQIVLFSDGNRNTEDFLEVHIYNDITVYAIKKAYIPKRSGRTEMLKIKKMQEKHGDKISVT